MYVKTAGMSGYRGMGQATAASAAVSGGISAGVQLASTAASLWLNSLTLSHDADTATTQIVNRLAPLLQANVNAYLAGPGTCADQAAAMDGYLTAVQFLFSAQGCGNGSYGSAGNACISDRFGPGGATDPNAKYPWANYYYFPIANDPRAAACAAALSLSNPDAAEESALQNLANAVTGNPGQTSAGDYASTSASSASTSASSALNSTILGLPVWAWAIGVVALVLINK